MTPVEKLKKEIEAAASKKGWLLYRWRRNPRCGVRITYALHRGYAKPVRSEMADGLRVHLTELEGRTTRCEAYRMLKSLLEMIPELPDVRVIAEEVDL